MSGFRVLDRFLTDIATHQMQVLRDDGLYRHLQFRRPGTYCMGFDIVTYPGYLVISGDMGAYVFTRVADMLTFFRHDKGELWINPGYWAEKCMAADRNGKTEEFSEDRFRAVVLERLKDYCDGDEALHAELLEEVTDTVFSRFGDGDVALYTAISNVERNGHQVFGDFWECNCREYTFHFLWICHAIAWAVIQYDAAPAAGEAT